MPGCPTNLDERRRNAYLQWVVVVVVLLFYVHGILQWVGVGCLDIVSFVYHFYLIFPVKGSDID